MPRAIGRLTLPCALIAGTTAFCGCASGRLTVFATDPAAEVTIYTDGKATKLQDQISVLTFRWGPNANQTDVEIVAALHGKPPDEVWIVVMNDDTGALGTVTQLASGTERIPISPHGQGWYSVKLIWRKSDR